MRDHGRAEAGLGVESSSEDMGAGHVSETTPVQAGHLWRKQVLPLGKVTLPRFELDLTPAYLADLVTAFEQGAFDVVPFQLTAGWHTSDPERCHGEVRGLEVTAAGLDALILADEAGNRAIMGDPGAGVPGCDAAPRIIEDYHRADGAVFAAAIQHVLGTPSPLITGLRRWEPVP
jgi:hypothetical protein